MTEKANDIVQTFPSLAESLGDEPPLAAYVLVETRDHWYVLTSEEAPQHHVDTLMATCAWFLPLDPPPGDHPMRVANGVLASAATLVDPASR